MKFGQKKIKKNYSTKIRVKKGYVQKSIAKNLKNLKVRV